MFVLLLLLIIYLFTYLLYIYIYIKEFITQNNGQLIPLSPDINIKQYMYNTQKYTNTTSMTIKHIFSLFFPSNLVQKLKSGNASEKNKKKSTKT